MRHERVLARANIPRSGGAQMLVSLGREFATDEQTVTATNQDDGAHVVDIGETPRTDILPHVLSLRKCSNFEK